VWKSHHLKSAPARCFRVTCTAFAILGVSLTPRVFAAETPSSAGTEATSPDNNRFDVLEYRVLGNTTLGNRDIERVLYPFLGLKKTLADVELARAALEKAYHDRGFGTVYTDIPEQDVAEGIVRLRVTEGRLHEVRIAGARYFSERKILAAVPSAAVGTVPNLPQLQQELSVVTQQSSDRAVVPVLKAGPLPGTIDMSLNVTDQLPVHGSLEFDNQYTPGTKPLRASASLSYGNLFQRFDTLSFQYQASPQDVSQVNVLAVNYAFGAELGAVHPSVYFINSNSNVPTVGTIGVLGEGQIYGSRFAFPLSAAADASSITLGIDYKHFRETIGLAGTPALRTPISYLNLSLSFGGGWTSGALSESLSVTANFGPRGAVNDSSAFANKRFKGAANYFYVKLGDNLSAHLPWGFTLIARVDGQFTVEPLITNEDFTISGADGVRGYLEAEVLADNGVKGSVQLQSPQPRWHSYLLGDLYLFYDAGRANLIDALPGEPALTTLRSFGAGLDLLPLQKLTGNLSWARPLISGPYTRRGDSRWLFMVRGSF
jgi:hemolysin activation/secretion protein